MPRAIGLSTQKCAWSNLDTPSLIFPNLDWPDLEEIFLVRREMAALFSFLEMPHSSIRQYFIRPVSNCVVVLLHLIQIPVSCWKHYCIPFNRDGAFYGGIV